MSIIRKIWNKINAVSYQPLIEVRIFKDRLLHNLNEYQKTYSKVKFAPVLKSNAYGHGLEQVAKILDKESIAFFMVDSFYEALVLRREGIKSKILILGYATIEQINKCRLSDVSFGIIDLQQLKNIAQNLKRPTSFQLKIDTGMHRQGILVEQVDEAIKLVKSNPNILLEGICTHFADADGNDQTFTLKQIEVWNNLARKIRQVFPQIKYVHASNSAGNFYSEKIEANVSRLGLGLYGINLSPFQPLNLKPALEMRSIISSIKTIQAGEKVGYGVTYEAQKPMKIATVPVGYKEGVDRRLSNKGFFKIGRTFCPIVGRVSMNMSSIDVSEVPGIKLEDDVVAISAEGADKNSVENIAKICDCPAHEILVHIPKDLRRNVL